LIDLGVEEDILEKRGSWYSYEGETIAQGRSATKEWLEENPEIRASIKRQIRVALGLIDEEDAEEEEGQETSTDEETAADE
jgi:recombination protein RecA